MRSRTTTALLILALLSPLAAFGQGIQQGAQDPSFKPLGTYLLQLDGQTVDAEFFHSKATNSILILTDELSNLVELQPRGNQILTYPHGAFFENADGTYDRLPDASPASTTRYQLEGSLPRFEVEGRMASITPKPPLLGPKTRQEIIAYNPAYGERAVLYTPHDEYVAQLRAYEEPVRVMIYFGSWCSVCDELMPHIFRVEEALADSKISFEYYGIPRDFSDPEVQRMEVRSIPAGFIYLDGEVIGKANGYSWRHPDMTLRNALLGGLEPGSD